MKRDVANFVANCTVSQQVKVVHLWPGVLFQEIKLLLWKWVVINMNFVIGLPWSQN